MVTQKQHDKLYETGVRLMKQIRIDAIQECIDHILRKQNEVKAGSVFALYLIDYKDNIILDQLKRDKESETK